MCTSLHPALERFRELFNAAVADHARTTVATEVPSGAEVRLHEADRAADVVSDLTRLEPCGPTNPAPVMAVLGARVLAAKPVRGGHLQLKIQTTTGETLHGFGMSMGDRAQGLVGLDHIDVTGRLRRDTFRGGSSVGIRIDTIGETRN